MAFEANGLTGKVALVTGSSSGVGEAIAILLAKHGASVTLCGRNATRLEAALEKCVQASGDDSKRFLTVPGDITDSAYRARLLESTVQRFGKLDFLICNAGEATAPDSLQETTEETFDTLVNLNFKSTFFLIQAAVPHLSKTQGNIMITSSVLSKVSSRASVYSMIKAALDHMAKCLALDLAPSGVRINTINPSFMSETRVVRTKETPVDGTQEFMSSLGAHETTKQPLENRLLTPTEAAEAAVFLVSDRAKFITGHNLVIDGGRSLVGAFPF